MNDSELINHEIGMFHESKRRIVGADVVEAILGIVTIVVIAFVLLWVASIVG